MSMISKLRFGPQMVTPESEVTPSETQKPELAAPSTGVASATDNFESGNSVQTDIFAFMPQRASDEHHLLQPEAVEASTVFDSLTILDVQPPPSDVGQTSAGVVEFSEQTPDRVSDRINRLHTKTETHRSEEQDSEARAAKGYSDFDDLLKEMRK